MAELQSFKVYLIPESGEGEYHIKNEPGEEQRRHLVERGDSVMVQADLVGVIHGTLSKAQSASCPSGDPATLIIIEFRFHPNKNSRRFESARIKIIFTGKNADPEVLRIAPYGKFSLDPAQKQVELDRAANASVQGGALGVSVSVGLKYDLKQSFTERSEATLRGVILLERRSQRGQKNAAEWIVEENPNTKRGLPFFLRTAILLKRKPSSDEESAKFQATLKIKADVDWKSSVGILRDRLLGRLPEDDPINFNPQLPPTIPGLDADNLDKMDLSTLSDVIATTTLRSPVRDQ
ncbi:MAG: hypothetical protein MMC33_004078 [Icmadophila ericetorum]|nr:hypothetical protein [Icmadophila ericetorum]